MKFRVTKLLLTLQVLMKDLSCLCIVMQGMSSRFVRASPHVQKIISWLSNVCPLVQSLSRGNCFNYIVLLFLGVFHAVLIMLPQVGEPLLTFDCKDGDQQLVKNPTVR